MKPDQSKTREELIRELNDLRQRLKETDHDLVCQCREHEESAEALRISRVIIDRSPAILFRRKAGDDPHLVYVSPNISQLGYTAEEFLAGEVHFRDIVHPDDHDRLGSEIMGYAEQGVEEYEQIYRMVTRSGEVRWVQDQTSVVVDEADGQRYNQGIVVDITERQIAEGKLRKSEEKFRRIVETAGEGFVLMDEALAITDVNDAYCRLTGYTRDELLGRTPLDFATDDYLRYLLANRQEFLDRDYREFEGTITAKNGRHIPILVHGSSLRDDRGEIIGNMAFVTDMTEQKKALALAGEVQKSLLPQRDMAMDGLEVAGKNVSCDEIGGDYFDFLWRQDMPGSPFGVVVGDITGHGVDSALLMTTARAFLRMRASQPGSITDIVNAMNRHLAADVLESGKFMTLFYMTIDPAGNRIEWVRAGHDPALVYDPVSDTFEELKGSGVALGLDESFRYAANRKTGLHRGQIFALGTDGVWESRNKAGEMFGKKRFQAIIRAKSGAGAGEILDAVFEELGRFMAGTRPEDDITLVILKWIGERA